MLLPSRVRKLWVVLQNVILTSQAAGGQTVVLASQALRAQGGTLVLQQGATQQILLPPGFQGGTLNIKTLQGLQGLQGLKVIPLAQTAAAASNKGEGSSSRFYYVMARVCIECTHAHEH